MSEDVREIQERARISLISLKSFSRTRSRYKRCLNDAVREGICVLKEFPKLARLVTKNGKAQLCPTSH